VSVFLSLVLSMARYIDTALTEEVILRIKKLRDKNGISQQQFYDDTGIHLARIESEKRDIPLSTLQRICRYFELTLSEFLKGL
jgi:transcriptional regulator with XRE-family HTH domain